MAGKQVGFRTGFTLVEVLVALVVAGILAAMIASVAGEGIFASQALLKQEEADAKRIALRRILHRDIKDIKWETGIKPEPEGFRLLTGHNTLIAASLPVDVTWSFSRGEIIRTEQSTELDYSREQVLSAEVKLFSLDLFCPAYKRWIRLENWMAGQDRPDPSAFRLKLVLGSDPQFEIVEYLPGHE